MQAGVGGLLAVLFIPHITGAARLLYWALVPRIWVRTGRRDPPLHGGSPGSKSLRGSSGALGAHRQPAPAHKAGSAGAERMMWTRHANAMRPLYQRCNGNLRGDQHALLLPFLLSAAAAAAAAPPSPLLLLPLPVPPVRLPASWRRPAQPPGSCTADYARPPSSPAPDTPGSTAGDGIAGRGMQALRRPAG